MGTPSSASLYQIALASDFERLHPRMQQRFGFSSTDGIASIGTGVMDEVWRGRFYTLPFLYAGILRNISFPERGRQVPFRLENYAYRDALGRETLCWIRTFEFPRCQRLFDTAMIYSVRRNGLVDYFGTGRELAVDIELSVDERGGVVMHTGAQFFERGPVRFAVPDFFSIQGIVHEWFDDSDQRFHISVDARSKTLGPLFGYTGSFTVEWRPCDPSDVPARARAERRE